MEKEQKATDKLKNEIKKIVKEIEYHLETIDEQGFSNSRTIEAIKDQLKRL